MQVSENGRFWMGRRSAERIDVRFDSKGLTCFNFRFLRRPHKGYLSEKLTQQLHQSGIQLLTPIRRKMKKRPKRTGFELYLLQYRALIETVIDQLKNQSQIQHTRHRSMTGFLVNLMSGLVAYALSSNKPKLSLSKVQALQVSA